MASMLKMPASFPRQEEPMPQVSSGKITTRVPCKEAHKPKEQDTLLLAICLILLSGCAHRQYTPRRVPEGTKTHNVPQPMNAYEPHDQHWLRRKGREIAGKRTGS